ncbi:response regulator [Microbacterium sp. K27]|uniref:response regulator n=1 Tax=Microbacterium sp. K27 TaxID=2305445 RepID=UPI00109BA82A|nr:response regulator [Microbacterium sp. K27]
MYVSVEVITMLATAVTLLVAIIRGFGWMINRMDARFAAQDARFDARCDAMETKFDSRCDALDAKIDVRCDAQDAKFDTRFDTMETKSDARFDRVEQQIFEVKIAIARLEGPAPRLIAAR